MVKTKCPKCNGEGELVFDKHNFNMLFELIQNLNERIVIIEKKLKK
jgi:hypothetical protein